MNTPTDAPATPLHGSFAGHETFPFRYAWLKKGVDGLTRQPDIFSRDAAMVRLGVGRNMVRAIRHWCLATQVVQEHETLPGTRTRRLDVTDFGRSLLTDDLSLNIVDETSGLLRPLTPLGQVYLDRIHLNRPALVANRMERFRLSRAEGRLAGMTNTLRLILSEIKKKQP